MIYTVSLHKRAQTSIVISVQEVAKCACVGGFGGRAATYRPEVSCIVSLVYVRVHVGGARALRPADRNLKFGSGLPILTFSF